jgi:hypothetical protein
LEAKQLLLGLLLSKETNILNMRYYLSPQVDWDFAYILQLGDPTTVSVAFRSKLCKEITYSKVTKMGVQPLNLYLTNEVHVRS